MHGSTGNRPLDWPAVRSALEDATFVAYKLAPQRAADNWLGVYVHIGACHPGEQRLRLGAEKLVPALSSQLFGGLVEVNDAGVYVEDKYRLRQALQHRLQFQGGWRMLWLKPAAALDNV